MRPRTLAEVVGQDHLLGPQRVLRRAVETGEIPSIVFWGPPGSGKTTLAHLLAAAIDANFVPLSAVTSGVREVKEMIARAEAERKARGRRTILFVDEIHRFNKSQQDAFLPHVERGTILLMGATTENPSFEINAALLSRVKVLTLSMLDADALRAILERAISDVEYGLGSTPATWEDGALDLVIRQSDGDARRALNTLEVAYQIASTDSDGRKRLDRATIEEALQQKTILYDREGEEHYNLISALHKSLRDSDPDGGLYWLVRMLEGGEDPLYIARRLVRFASEDVGMADPRALPVAMAAKDAVHFIGMPEGDTALAQAVVYLATAPKSNALYLAVGAAREDVRKHGYLPVPMVIRNAVTRLMKNLGYGNGYRYAHDYEDAAVEQDHLPDALRGHTYYHPTTRGEEEEVGRRLAALRAKLAAKGKQAPPG